MRVGTGFDLHRLGAERPLVLGGVTVPDSPGLIGHSDADCVLHAITDALLGAAGLPDIGHFFPDTDPQWKDADSAALLEAAATRLVGWTIENVDCTVLAEWPKLAPYREVMKTRIATLLGLDVSAVGVKFTTMEGLGPIGRGEAIACQAVCLLARNES